MTILKHDIIRRTFKVVEAYKGDNLLQSLVNIGWAESNAEAKKLLVSKAISFSWVGIPVPEGYVFCEDDVGDYVKLVKGRQIAYVYVVPPKKEKISWIRKIFSFLTTQTLTTQTLTTQTLTTQTLTGETNDQSKETQIA